MFKAKLVLSTLIFVLVAPVVIGLVSFLVFAFMENQVVEFCQDIETGMNRDEVLAKAEQVSVTNLEKVVFGKYQVQLSPLIFQFSSCNMGFENNVLSEKFLSIH